MSRTALLIALATTALASPTLAQKTEVLPLSPAASTNKNDDKLATGAISTPSIQPTEAQLPTPPVGTNTNLDPAQIEKSHNPAERQVAKIESIASDGTVKDADVKATENKPSQENNDAAFEAKAIEPEATLNTQATNQTASFTAAQQTEIEKVVLNVIENNSEILVKAIQSYGENQQKEMLQKEAEKMAKFKEDLLNDSTAIVGGNPNGIVKLIVFADPNCPHCRHFEANLSEVKGLFSNLKIYLRPWPIMGKESADVVVGLMAAAKQGYDKYDSLVMRIASSNEKIDKTKFLKFSKELGLDTKKLQKTMDSEDVRKEIKYNHELAVKMGLDATPTIVMFDAEGTHILLPGDKESLKKSLTEAKA